MRSRLPRSERRRALALRGTAATHALHGVRARILHRTSPKHLCEVRKQLADLTARRVAHTKNTTKPQTLFQMLVTSLKTSRNLPQCKTCHSCGRKRKNAAMLAVQYFFRNNFGNKKIKNNQSMFRTTLRFLSAFLRDAGTITAGNNEPYVDPSSAQTNLVSIHAFHCETSKPESRSTFQKHCQSRKARTRHL